MRPPAGEFELRWQGLAPRARWRAALLAAALGAGWACGPASSTDEPSTASTPAAVGAASTTQPSAPVDGDEALAADPRIGYLLAPCSKSEHYDVDTANLEGMLMEMLLRGERDTLRRAREELAQLGARGVAVARRVIDTYRHDPDGFAHLRNAVDVCHRSDDPSAREVLLLAIDSAFESVAVQAVVALGKHGVPADLDAAQRVFEQASSENKIKVAIAMHDIDAVRASLMYLDWMDAGQVVGQWDVFSTSIARSTSSEVARRANELRPHVAERFHAFLAAPAARAGDEAALEFLRSQLRADEAWRRENAVAAFAAAGRPDEFADLALGDPDPGVRLRAIQSLTPSSPKSLEALREGSRSADENIASTCLNILNQQGDPQSIDRTLELLGETSATSLGLAMGALAPVLARDSSVAERALAILTLRASKEESVPLVERVSILESIARVPLDDAARLLREAASEAQGEIKGMPARRWFFRLIGNLGEPGQRLAAEELSRTEDPAMRLDLLEALTVRASPFARDELLRLVEDGALRPYELVFALERLTSLATVEQAAGVLKRAVLRVEHPTARRSLQCLMWRFYPGPR